MREKVQGAVASQNFVTRPGSQFVQSGRGAVERTVESKLQDVVSILDFIPQSEYAAIKAGTSNYDATAAIEAAVSAAAGKPVYLPDGRYKCTKYIDFVGFGNGRLWFPDKSAEMAPRFAAGTVFSGDEYAHLSAGGFIVGGAGESGNGTVWKSQFNSAWSGFSPSIEGSVIEIAMLPRGAFVSATSTNGTNSITLIDPIYPPIANLIKVNDVIGFGNTIYRVNTVTYTGSNITGFTLKTVAGGAVTLGSETSTFRWCYGLGTTKVNISGNVVTRVGGDPFFSVFGDITDVKIIYNNTEYTCSARSGVDQLTVSGLSTTASGVWITYKQRIDFFNIFRLQGQYGGSEENFAIAGSLDGSWLLSSQYAGQGKYGVVKLGLSTDSNLNTDVSPVILTPDAKVYIGNQSQTNSIPSSGPLVVGRDVATAQGPGTTQVEILRAQSRFNGTDYRCFTLDFVNNFLGANLQSWNATNRSLPAKTFISPYGGATHLGVPTTYSFSSNTEVVVGGNFFPYQDNTYLCGANGVRWSAVWSATGTIQTSDARLKEDVQSCDLGLDFILSLDPVSYRWIEGGYEEQEISKPVTEEVPIYEEVQVEKVVIEEVDGKLVRKVALDVEQRAIYEDKPVYDEDGLQLIDENGNPIMQRVHKTENKEVIKTNREFKIKKGQRVHYGLIAQQVKEVLEQSGSKDFAGWVLSDKDDPNSQQALRYDQFIAPLIKAVQELSAEVEYLKTKLS